MTVPGRDRWQTPDEVFEALRHLGWFSQAFPVPPFAFASAPPRGGGPVSPQPFERTAPLQSRTAEAVARFIQVSGGRCLMAKALMAGDAKTPIDSVVTVLSGGTFVVALGADSIAPDISPKLSELAQAVRDLGGRVLVYYIDEPAFEPPERVELLSLRASIEPFVREALRSHAEMCALGFGSDDEARVLPVLARFSDGRSIAIEEALYNAVTTSRRTLLFGDFGCGKSVQLLRAASAMANEYLRDHTQSPCPLLLPLRGMRADMPELLREHVPGLSMEAFWLAAELGMIVTILDGLDESATSFSEALLMLGRLSESTFAKVVVSTSTAPITSEGMLAQLIRGANLESVLFLSGLGEEQAKEMIQRSTASKAVADALHAELERIDSLENLAKKPALLDLLVHRRDYFRAAGPSCPAAQMYGFAARDWLSIERLAFLTSGLPAMISAPASVPPSGAPPSGTPSSATPSIPPRSNPLDRRLLAARMLARKLFQSGKAAISTEDLTLALTTPGNSEPVQKAVEQLRRSAFVVQCEAPNQLRFAHTSFLEYFLVVDISARFDEGQADAIDLPKLPLRVVALLCGMEGWAKRKKKVRDILFQPYKKQISENALLILYGGIAAKFQGERLGKLCGEEIPCGAKLAGADLEGQSLPWISLPEADLSGANLRGADLTCADLRSVRFDHAMLDHSVLDGADLEWASFGHAEMYAASMVSANLANVNWSGARDEAAVRIGARVGGHALWTPGIDAGRDTRSRREIELGPHMGQALAISPNGKTLAIARGFTVATIDAAQGHVVTVFEHGSSCVLAAAFSPDGMLLVSASKDGAIRVWDVHTGMMLRMFETEAVWVMALAFAPDGSTMLSGSDNGPLRMWDVRRGYLLNSVDVHISWFFSVAFSPDGTVFAAALSDGTLRIWDTQKLTVLHSLEGILGPYMCLSFSPDGKELVLTSEDDSIRVIRLEEPIQTRTLRAIPMSDAEAGVDEPEELLGRAFIELGGPAMAVAYAPSGGWLASVAGDGSVVVWNAKNGRIESIIPSLESACAVLFSPDGRELFFTRIDGSVHVANPKTGTVLRSFKSPVTTVDGAVFSPAGDTLASSAAGGDIRVWDARRGDLLHTLPGPAAMGMSLAFSLDGDTLAVAMIDGSLNIWDARQGVLRKTLRTDGHLASALSFSPVNDQLVSGGGDGALIFWDIHSGDVLHRIDPTGSRIATVAFSPDGDFLAAAGESGPIYLLQPESGELISVLEGHTEAVHSVVFLPDSSTLASASSDGTIRIWDVWSGNPVRVVEGRTGQVHSLAFSPEGGRLAAASADGITRIWDADGSELLCALEGHAASVSSVAFSMDGDMLVTASADGTVRIWRAADGLCLCILLAAASAWAAMVANTPFFIAGGNYSKLVRFTSGQSSTPASLWAPLFERPDLVAKALWGDIPVPESMGLGNIASCEAALLEARARLDVIRTRREGGAASNLISKISNPFAIAGGSEITARSESQRQPAVIRRAFTWIHISDLHFGVGAHREKHRFDQHAVTDAIVRDIKESNFGPPDFIFVAGDIAWNGQPGEYEQAGTWLKSLLEAANCPPERLRIVPGNHDVDRAKASTKPVARAHSEIRVAPEELDNELENEALREILFAKLGGYAEFLNSFGPHHPVPGPNGIDWWECLEPINGVRGKLRIAGLSTVWISDGSDGRLHKGQAVPFIRNMILGERQMRRAFGEGAEGELLFIVTHHPLDWINRDAVDEFFKVLGRRSYIHLCGHIHDASMGATARRFLVQGNVVRYFAGAAHGEALESRKHGYGWGGLRFNPLGMQWEVGFAPRIYDEERRIMRPDVARYTLNEEGFVWDAARLPWRAPYSQEIQAPARQSYSEVVADVNATPRR